MIFIGRLEQGKVPELFTTAPWRFALSSAWMSCLVNSSPVWGGRKIYPPESVGRRDKQLGVFSRGCWELFLAVALASG